MDSCVNFLYPVCLINIPFIHHWSFHLLNWPIMSLNYPILLWSPLNNIFSFNSMFITKLFEVSWTKLSSSIIPYCLQSLSCLTLSQSLTNFELFKCFKFFLQKGNPCESRISLMTNIKYLSLPMHSFLDGPHKSICTNWRGFSIDVKFLDLNHVRVNFPIWQYLQT